MITPPAPRWRDSREQNEQCEHPRHTVTRTRVVCARVTPDRLTGARCEACAVDYGTVIRVDLRAHHAVACAVG